jgi:enterochelin esterase family protein
MKKQVFLFILTCIMCGATAHAQQALFGGQQIISPETHNDNSVTFRLDAPNADTVLVTGDFLPPEKLQTPFGEMDGPGKRYLEKDEKGIWTYTTAPLPSELYSYSFIIDGFITTDPNNPFLIRDVASVTNVFIIGGDHADLYRVQDVPHGTVTRSWYNSPGLEMDRRLTIYTPPGYENSNIKYPVLYLLHGAGGDEEAWISLGRTAQILDNLIARGTAQPMIVVMPNGNVIQDAAPGEGNKGFYKPQFMVPKTMDGIYESNFTDIITFVENNYRVKTEKTNRAIAGLSMGGFHSLHISRYHENTFDYIGLFSAAIMPREDATGIIYNDIDSTLKKQVENGYTLYWIGMGKTDFLYDSGVEFRKKMDELGARYIYRESEGGHIWRNWRIYLSEFTPLLFK